MKRKFSKLWVAQKSECKNSSGFTLIEMAFVVLISGLMGIVYTQAYFRYVEDQKTQVTNEALDTIQSALKEYHSLTGVYPCPASPTAAQNNTQYGIASCALSVATTGRDIDGVPGDDPVFIGTVPFKTLLDPDNNPGTDDGLRDVPLTASDTIDGWGNKITYAVSGNLLNLTTYDQNFGAIRVIDEFDQTIVDPAGSAHVVLVSHGPNGRGARTVDGQLTEACALTIPTGPPPSPPPVITPMNETQNCDGNGIFMAGLKNLAEQSYNDDLVRYFSLRADRLWTDLGGGRAMNTNSGNVGIGTTTPEQKLDVSGNVAATQVVGDVFCDKANDPTSCMPITTLAGNEPTMSCGVGGGGVGAGANRAVRAIQNNQVECTQVFTSTPVGACPAGQIMVGVSNLTGMICEDVP